MATLKAKLAKAEQQLQNQVIVDQFGEDKGAFQLRALYTPLTPSENGSWFAVTAAGGLQIGERAELSPSFTRVGDVAFRWRTDASCPEIFCRPSQDHVQDFGRKLRKEAKAAAEPIKAGGASSFRALAAVDDRMDLVDSDGENETRKSKDLDVRILPIRLDDSGERWRLLAESVSQNVAEDFDDWPLDNIRSCKKLLVDLRRAGKTFLQSHADWVTFSGVKEADRSIHEHRILSKALDLAVSYDQLQLVNLASFEVLVKRRMLIEQAYRGKNGIPSYPAAEFFMGYKDGEEGAYIDPELEKYVAKRQKEKNEFEKEMRVKREETAARNNAKGGGKG